MHAAVPPHLPTSENDQAIYVAGLVALRDGDCAKAIPLLEQAVRNMPCHAGRLRNLAQALLAAEHYEAAARAATAACDLNPGDPDILFILGSALSSLGDFARAVTTFQRGLKVRPDHAPSWLSLANRFTDMDDLTSGESHYRRALEIEPTLAEAHTSLGYVLTRTGRLPDAIAAFDAALLLRPELPQAHWNRAIALLLSGDLASGFAAFEWRKRHPRFQRDFPPLAGPAWRGANPAGQRVLIRTEQGTGDAIQFARYALCIRDRGGLPIVLCNASLRPLIERLDGVLAFEQRDPLPQFDSWIDQASLPLAFATTIDTIPSSNGYLAADPALVHFWRQFLPMGRKVGVAFAGNPQHTGDHRRSIPPIFFAPLLATAGATFVNLQHGPAAHEIGLPPVTHLLRSYDDTAALIETLDLVITADTSVGHLSGALGKPTWVLLPHAPDWRWMMGRSDSPWYDSIRLYRQQSAGDWLIVLRQVGQDLRQWLSDPDTAPLHRA